MKQCGCETLRKICPRHASSVSRLDDFYCQLAIKSAPSDEGSGAERLREFFSKKHLADKHNFDLINGRLRRRRIFTVSTVILCGRTQFAPNGVQFPLQFCLRDTEDVIPYDRIAVDSLYIQQDFDLNSCRTIPPSRLTPCRLHLRKGGEGKCKHLKKLYVAMLSPSYKSNRNPPQICKNSAKSGLRGQHIGHYVGRRHQRVKNRCEIRRISKKGLTFLL